MRNVVLALLAWSLGSTGAFAQGSWAENLFKLRDKLEAVPKLTHDFGNVARGTQLLHRFEIYNPYKVPLNISYRVGCTCVTVTLSDQVLQPEHNGFIDAKMDARRFAGPRSVNIYLTV